MKPRPDPRFVRLLALVVGAAILLVLLRLWATAPRWSDFLAFYNGGQMAAEGKLASLYDQAVLNQRGAPHFLYAPLYTALFLPLSVLPFALARIAWGLLSVASLLWAAWISQRWSRVPLVLVLLALALCFPSYIALIIGQTSPLTLLLFAALALLVWRGEVGVLAGLLAGANLYKPQLLAPLLLLWLLQRQWRALGGVALAALLVGLGSLLLSPAATLAFPAARGTIGDVVMAAVVARGINPTLYTVAGPLVALLASVGSTVALLVAWRRPMTPYHHALLWLAPLVITPYLGSYDLLLLLLPLSFLAPVLRRDRPVLLAALLLWLLLGAMLWPPARFAIPWAMLLLFALCFWRAMTGEAPPTVGALGETPRTPRADSVLTP